MIYTNNTFKGFEPTGTAAVVHADSKIAAAQKLNTYLKEIGLNGNVEAKHMVPFTTLEHVRILADGDY